MAKGFNRLEWAGVEVENAEHLQLLVTIALRIRWPHACGRGPPGQDRTSVKEAIHASMLFTIDGLDDALTQGAP